MMDKNFLPPEDREFAEQLETLAERVKPNAAFERELEKRLMQTQSPEPKAKGFFAQAMPGIGLAVGLILLALVLTRILRTLPPQPGAGNTPAPQKTLPSPQETLPAPEPIGEKYDHYGQTVYLQAELPSAPAEAAVYNYQPEMLATLEDARAFAARFRMNGKAYETNDGASDIKDFLFADGNRRLIVRSDRYFQYYPDLPRYTAAVNGAKPPANAEAVIDEFMKSHGFDFDYKILPSELYGGYLAAPLTPDGHIICYEYFKCAGLLFQLDEQGILYVDGNLPRYETVGQYGIISAEEAFQFFIDASSLPNPQMAAGTMEGTISPNTPIQTWLRPRPLDTTITLHGYLNSVPSAEGGAPLVTLDGYTVTGNTADIPAAFDNTFVAATGQLHEQDGVKTFALEKWAIYTNEEDGLLGAISLQNRQVILNTTDDEVLVLPDASELPLPLDNAFVIGVRLGDTFDWKSIDLRNVQGGGGGGGGAIPFYKLNLTGAPVPFPTPEPRVAGSGGGGAVEAYLVQKGDTINSIAAENGITPEELMRLNDMTDPSQMQVGQTLTIHAESMSLPQKVEGMRGYLAITIYKQADGSQRVEYGFLVNEGAPFPYVQLEGENLEALQAYQNRPVDVWGTLQMKEGKVVLSIDRYEIPFPDLQFQILRGKQTPVTLNGQPAMLFTTDDGKTYVQFNPGGGMDGSTVGNLDDEVLIEGLIVPDESFGGYPAVRVFSAAMAINPDNGEAQELQILADQVSVVDEATETPHTPPTLAIERVELVYYMPDPRSHIGEFSPDERYLQPAWLFTGHYSDGTVFFLLVQALQQEYLLPEPAPFTPPG